MIKIILNFLFHLPLFITHTTQLCSEEDKEDKEEDNNINKMGKGEAAALTKAFSEEEEERKRAKQIRKAEKKANKKRKLELAAAAEVDDDEKRKSKKLKKLKKSKKQSKEGKDDDGNDANVAVVDSEDDDIFSSKKKKTNKMSVSDEEEVKAYVKEHHVTVSTKDAPNPILSFEKCHEIFPMEIVAALKKQGYEKPTPIQAFSWTIALTGRDIVAIAKTGSGKTCSFLLPALTRIKKNGGPQKAPEMELVNGRWKPGAVKPTSIVLAPTRELAIQINDECAKFCPAVKAKCVVLYGGAAKGDQLRALRGGADIVVATPGRINDFWTRHRDFPRRFPPVRRRTSF